MSPPDSSEFLQTWIRRLPAPRRAGLRKLVRGPADAAELLRACAIAHGLTPSELRSLVPHLLRACRRWARRTDQP